MNTPAEKGGSLGKFAQAQEQPAPAPAEAPAKRPPRNGVQRKKGKRRTLTDGRVQSVFYLQPAGVKELKRLGVEDERPVTDLITEAINDYLQRRGRPPVA